MPTPVPRLNRCRRWAAVLGANLLLSAPVVAAPAPGVPALYPNRAEAEKAAKLHFNGSGPHRMGNQWLPCASHGDPQGSGQSH